ncbi:MAG: hypothetical protein AAGA93_28210, partial [Actinomycetota bacterium]
AASVGAAPTGTPAQQQTPGQPGTPATGPDGRPGGRSIGTAGRVAIAVAGLLTVGGCAVVVGLAAGDDDNDRNGDGQATTDVVEEDTSPATEVGAVGSGGDPADTDVDSAVGDGTDGTDGTDDEDLGSRDQPLPYDQPVEVTWRAFGDADGSRWTTVIGPPRDITDDVMAANQFNDPPPDGVRFVGFDVSMTLLDADAEPLSTGFSFSWELLGGSTARVYDFSTIETESFGCGVVPDAFDDFDEVFTGGTLAGTVCIPLPIADLDHPDTRVAMHFLASDSRAVFGP